MKSQLQQLARPMYSNPPIHGALIVSTILGDPELKSLWLKEVKVNLKSSCMFNLVFCKMCFFCLFLLYADSSSLTLLCIILA